RSSDLAGTLETVPTQTLALPFPQASNTATRMLLLAPGAKLAVVNEVRVLGRTTAGELAPIVRRPPELSTSSATTAQSPANEVELATVVAPGVPVALVV